MPRANGLLHEEPDRRCNKTSGEPFTEECPEDGRDLPVPAGVYGLVLLLGALCSGVVKLPDVENFGALMIEMMPLMFVPPAAGVIVHYKEVLSVIAPFTAAAIISTAAVMAATGFVTQRMMRRRGA